MKSGSNRIAGQSVERLATPSDAVGRLDSNRSPAARSEGDGGCGLAVEATRHDAFHCCAERVSVCEWAGENATSTGHRVSVSPPRRGWPTSRRWSPIFGQNPERERWSRRRYSSMPSSTSAIRVLGRAEPTIPSYYIASATDVAGLSASKAFSVTVIVTNDKLPIRQGAAAFRKSSRPEHKCAVLEFSGAGAASCSVSQEKCRSFSRGTTMIGRLIRDSSQLFYALASRPPK
jgi:hypothetical protein